MPESSCYHCHQPIPAAQSFFEGRGHKVCLNCFRQCQACVQCGFPEKRLHHHPALGKVCHFCLEERPVVDQGVCHLCSRKIKEGERLYAEQGVKVCIDCFNQARQRCFTCRFPAIKQRIAGIGGVCEFCAPRLVTASTQLAQLLAPLGPFLAAHGHRVQIPPSLVRLDWRIILGMQREEPPHFPVEFFDEYIHWAYPVYHLGGKLYALPAMAPEWFVPIVAGQLAAQELCHRFGLSQLGERGPFYSFARAWVHYLSHSTAERLGYAEVARKLLRWPEASVGPDFEELRHLGQSKGPKGVIQKAQRDLTSLAKALPK
ncbi:MAG: hypothetical protein RRB13_06190 [bacterium]|nr:hypothetical protein [bacterium]